MNHVTVLLHEFMTRFIFPTAYLIYQHHHSWRMKCRKWDLEVQHINCISYWSRFSTSGHVTTFGLLTAELQHCSGMQDQVTWFISTAELSSEIDDDISPTFFKFLFLFFSSNFKCQIFLAQWQEQFINNFTFLLV